MKKTLITIAVIGFAGLMFFVGSYTKEALTLGDSSFPTIYKAPTYSTTTVNATSTQVASNVNRTLTIQNVSSTLLACKVDALGTTAASSTVTSSIANIDSHLVRPSTTLYNTITFGECREGMVNCFPFKGAVNCLSSASTTYSLISN